MAKINKRWCDQWRDQYGTTTKQNKIKFRKWEPQTYNFCKRRKTNKDLPQVYSIKRTCGRGTTTGKGSEVSEDEPQVYSVKKTCGSKAEDLRKAARSVPLHFPST